MEGMDKNVERRQNLTKLFEQPLDFIKDRFDLNLNYLTSYTHLKEDCRQKFEYKSELDLENCVVEMLASRTDPSLISQMPRYFFDFQDNEWSELLDFGMMGLSQILLTVGMVLHYKDIQLTKNTLLISFTVFNLFFGYLLSNQVNFMFNPSDARYGCDYVPYL